MYNASQLVRLPLLLGEGTDWGGLGSDVDLNVNRRIHNRRDFSGLCMTQASSFGSLYFWERGLIGGARE
ncbi:hypothetical protein DCO47_25130 [Pseudomonas sp. NDM]|nr:hypothetical protein DCO47_25130 [Pseudomonas sp. NDM]